MEDLRAKYPHLKLEPVALATNQPFPKINMLDYVKLRPYWRCCYCFCLVAERRLVKHLSKHFLHNN